MVVRTLTRAFIISKSAPSFPLLNHLSRSYPSASSPSNSRASSIPSPFSVLSSYTTSSNNPTTETAAPKRRNTLVNFSLSDSSDSESDSESERISTKQKEIDKAKLPPAYDPFNKKPVIEEPEDPTNLQEVFHKIRSDGLINNAVKMFDGLSKDGLTHEALELFSQIKDKGQMPDVVAHTAVIEAYANAGQPREALKVFLRMLASGVLPNAYTYCVLIKGLAASGDERWAKEAKKYVLEMVDNRGMRPNAGVCIGVFEGLVTVGLEEEGREVLEILKSKGVVPEEKMVREVLKDKRGAVYRTVMNVFYGK